MKLLCRLVLVLFAYWPFFAYSLPHDHPPSSKIYHELLKLKETKRILYIAAHPDDENTRLIAYLGNKEHAQVAYLSLTRGDGGQNLIGKELGVELGMIRTQELLKAREIDGGRQFFTRAIDFGYSKNPDETLNNWDKEKLLSDVVWIIRNYQPDIIINRFNTEPGTTHGHHTTSAILSLEAFDAAADPTKFPEQLNDVATWQAERVFWNAYSWGQRYEPGPDSKYHVFPVGEYNSLLGTTYSQIAAESRTMHKSQGFGATAALGDDEDFIELVKGKSFDKSPFEGLEDKWRDLANGEEILAGIEHVLATFNFIVPSESLADLLKIKELLAKADEDYVWLEEKREFLDNIILDVLGVEAQFVAPKASAYAGESLNTQFVFNNPSETPIALVNFEVLDEKFNMEEVISNNAVFNKNFNLITPSDHNISQPYWLREMPKENLYQVPDQGNIGKAFNSPGISGELVMQIKGQTIRMNIPLRYKFNDPVDGETQQPFVLVPLVTVHVNKTQVYAINDEAGEVEIMVDFHGEMVEGELRLEGLDHGAYRIAEETTDKKNKRKIFRVLVNGKTALGKSEVKARFMTANGDSFYQDIKQLKFSHIPDIAYFPPAGFDLVKLKLNLSDQRIGYIPGAGDDVPGVLTNLGYEVALLDQNDLLFDKLSSYTTIIIGIRAFNVNHKLANHYDALLKYVHAGGNLIVQYNTTASLRTEKLGPYPFKLSRKRVAVENSPVAVDFDLHPAMQGPNVISMEDFDDWIQERGLYFPEEWDNQYVTPITMGDPGESPSQGALLLADYGKGTFTYSGISWFRLLPAGVPGAIKLFVNLIEQGHE